MMRCATQPRGTLGALPAQGITRGRLPHRMGRTLIVRTRNQSAATAQAKDTGAATEVAVRFNVPHKAGWGKVLKAVGGSTHLGGWNAQLAPSLHWTNGDIWRGEIPLPPGQYEFKLVVFEAADAKAEWEACSNRVLQVPAFPGTLEVSCTWGLPSTKTVFVDAPSPVGEDPIEAAAAAAAEAAEAAAAEAAAVAAAEAEAAAIEAAEAAARKEAELAAARKDIQARVVELVTEESVGVTLAPPPPAAPPTADDAVAAPEAAADVADEPTPKAASPSPVRAPTPAAADDVTTAGVGTMVAALLVEERATTPAAATVPEAVNSEQLPEPPRGKEATPEAADAGLSVADTPPLPSPSPVSAAAADLSTVTAIPAPPPSPSADPSAGVKEKKGASKAAHQKPLLADLFGGLWGKKGSNDARD